MSAASTAALRPRHRSGSEVRSAATRLIPAALLVWAALLGLGYLITHGLSGTGFERWDASVDRWFARHRSGGWNTVTHWVTFGAETETVIAIGVLFFVGLRLTLHRWRESLFLAVALIGEVSIFVCTTLVIDRDRPDVPRLDEAPPTSSFPSGHTAASTTLYGALALIAFAASRRAWLRTLAVVAAVLMPIGVAFARMYRGMHYPTDVVAGALLGLVWLAITSTVLLRERR